MSSDLTRFHSNQFQPNGTSNQHQQQPTRNQEGEDIGDLRIVPFVSLSHSFLSSFQYAVTPETVDLANASWRYAMSGESPPFQQAKAKEASLTPLVFFYNQFYYFLFELLPDARALFTKGMKAQGRMLANVIKYIITNLKESDETILNHSLEHLARVHNQRGITADQYSVMGMVLVHTVRICTGPAFWTEKHKDAWVHIYSKMMTIIIPVVISGEMPIGQVEESPAKQSVEFYKKGNLNAEADDSSVTHTPTPPKDKYVAKGHTMTTDKTGTVTRSPSPRPPMMPGGSTCPALAPPTAGDDIEVSHTLKEHFRDNAEKHVAVLEAEARAAEEEEQKYKILSRVLNIAHRVETHLRETGGMVGPNGETLPAGTVTGHKLLRLLQSHNWVSDVSGAKTACAYFVQLHLMTRVDGQEGKHRSMAQLPTDEASALVGALQFPDDNTLYQFDKIVTSLTPPATPQPNADLIAPVPRQTSTSTSTTFTPHCYIHDLRPAGSILNALSPSQVPNLAGVKE